MNLLRTLWRWRQACQQARREQRQLAKIMCLLAALEAPPDVATELRRIAHADLSK